VNERNSRLTGESLDYMLDIVDDSVLVEVLSKLDRVQDILSLASVRVFCFVDPNTL